MNGATRSTSHLLELLALHLVHGDALDDAGVVHEDVDLAHLGVDLLHEGLDGHLVRDVAHIAVHVLDAGLLIVVEPPLEGGLVDVIEDDVLDAGGDKGLGDVEPDAVGGAGDPGILAFERERIGHLIEKLTVFLSCRLQRYKRLYLFQNLSAALFRF